MQMGCEIAGSVTIDEQPRRPDTTGRRRRRKKKRNPPTEQPRSSDTVADTSERPPAGKQCTPKGPHRSSRPPKAKGLDAKEPLLFIDQVRELKAREPKIKHRDVPTDPALLEMHQYCKVPVPARLDNWRRATPYEAKILSCVLDGSLPLDCPPEFLYQILQPTALARFWKHMRYNYGHVQFDVPQGANLQLSMGTATLCRLIRPKRAKDAAAADLCRALRDDVHTAWVSDDARHVVLSFNSKAKANRWRGQTAPFQGDLVTLMHHRRPHEPEHESEEVKVEVKVDTASPSPNAPTVVVSTRSVSTRTD
ncbi:hypothetical protein SDRG_03031 [Saprolegnia diclina VS20]|uniref:Uncharacterized protein n=1 Tax=Saprolegnia diclina (strain VS20) TaxID=1156394 RepID=T0S3H9_SAPDV|nr:hypothetical protein SDRG_03031 [Saprolegnia diclina VS20]EQC39598.1 hypothetical protein SDRG_03031 [Saprolegnia diclina VS20]|eukprot:XP_008606870.1 hypothetical protein SDRG_03031 [Saprolegnia diclina VS20]